MLFPVHFSDDQRVKLSDIASDIGLVSLASVVLPAVIDRFDTTKVIWGLVGTFFFWTISLWLRR